MEIQTESEQTAEIIVTVTLTEDDENPYLDRSYKRLVTRLKVPGFRPGLSLIHISEPTRPY